MIRIKSPVMVWKKIVSSLSSIREEAIIVVTQDGIKFKTIGGSHHEMILFIYPKEKILEFSTDADDEVQFRVDDLEKIIKRFDDKENLLCVIDNGVIKLTSADKDYQMLTLLRDRSAGTGIPDFPDDLKIPYQFEIPIDTADLKNMIDDISFIGTNFFLKVENDSIIAKGEAEHGRGFGDSQVKLKSVTGITPCEGRYSIEYLANFVKSVSAIIKEATISFGDTQKEDVKPIPLRIKLQVDDIGTITYHLAAMVQN